MYVIKKLRKNPHKDVVISSPKDLFYRVGLRAGSGVTTSSDPDKCPVVPVNGRKLDVLASADAMDYSDVINAENALRMANTENPQNEAPEHSEGAE